MLAAPDAIPPNPNTAAMSATIRNAQAQRNMVSLLCRYRQSDNRSGPAAARTSPSQNIGCAVRHRSVVEAWMNEKAWRRALARLTPSTDGPPAAVRQGFRSQPDDPGMP